MNAGTGEIWLKNKNSCMLSVTIIKTELYQLIVTSIDKINTNLKPQKIWRIAPYLPWNFQSSGPTID